MFFTKGEPERRRNCVIQPLKYRLLRAFDNTGRRSRVNGEMGYLDFRKIRVLQSIFSFGFGDGLTRKCKVSIVPMIIQLFQQQGMIFCFGLLLLIYTLLGQLYG